MSLFSLFSLLLPTACRGMGEAPRKVDFFDLQGHRGARGLHPENTWPSFLTALKYRMTTLEFDTVLTKDGVQIVHHDADLNPNICLGPNGEKVEKTPIRKLNYEYIATLDCGTLQNPRFPEQVPVPGARILTLPEFFEKFREYENANPWAKSVLFNIETKFPGDHKATPEELEQFATIMTDNVRKSGYADRTTVQSFAIEVLPLVKAKLPQVKTSALFAPSKITGLKMYLGAGVTERTAVLEAAQRVGADIISPYYLFSTADFNRLAHARGLLVIPWTVNEEEEMRMQIKAGVDGLISDYPDRLRKVWDELNSDP